MITENELKSIIAEGLNLNPKELPDTIDTNHITAWDSLGHLRLILTIEEKIGKRFDMEVIPTLTSLEAIQKEINGHSEEG